MAFLCKNYFNVKFYTTYNKVQFDTEEKRNFFLTKILKKQHSSYETIDEGIKITIRWSIAGDSNKLKEIIRRRFNVSCDVEII
jgi:hypothetical protein